MIAKPSKHRQGTRYFLCGLGLVLALVAFACGSGGASPPASINDQGLWVPNLTGSVSEFTGSALSASGTPTPNVMNLSADLDEPVGIAFDSSKNLWVSNFGAGTLTEFTLAQLNALTTTNNPAANVIGSGLDEPRGLAFDAAGNLWAANFGNNTLYMFTPGQLAAGGTQAPHVIISSSGLGQPAGLAFDKSGGLWVANEPNNTLTLFGAGQLAVTSTQTPAVIIASNANGSLDRPRGIAFDAAGDLWAANYMRGTSNLGTVVEFAAADLGASGSPDPAVTLSSTTVGASNSIDGCRGVVFDRYGSLWVGNFISDQVGSLVKFTKSQVATSGSPTPKVFLDSNSAGSNLSEPELLTFGPSIK